MTWCDRKKTEDAIEHGVARDREWFEVIVHPSVRRTVPSPDRSVAGRDNVSIRQPRGSGRCSDSRVVNSIRTEELRKAGSFSLHPRSRADPSVALIDSGYRFIFQS